MHRDRLISATFWLYVALVLRITLWPRLADPTSLAWLTDALAWLHAHGLPAGVGVPVLEAVANVLLFVPFGLLVPVVLGRGARATVALGAGFSTAIELTQLLLLPDRVPTVQDVVLNTAGTGLGVLTWLLVGHVRAGRTASVRSEA